MSDVISVSQHEMQLRDLHEGWKAHTAQLNETIRCQQIVLDQIAEALGLETGDVEGIGREIEGLKKGAGRYRWLRNDGLFSLPYVEHMDIAFQSGEHMDESLDKALTAGEVG